MGEGKSKVHQTKIVIIALSWGPGFQLAKMGVFHAPSLSEREMETVQFMLKALDT